MSSSASRREAARSGELGRTCVGEGPPPMPAPAPAPAAAAKARSGELLPKGGTNAAAAVRHEGWMVRYGRRKIGRSFFHTRYFVLDNKLLAYYKKQPKDNMVPLKSLLVDGNCRVEDRGLKTHHGQMVYVLCVYNKKEKDNPITQQDTMSAKNRKAFASLDFGMDLGGPLSFSDPDSGPEDEEELRPMLLHRTTIGKGLPDSVHDWTKEPDIGLSNQNDTNQANLYRSTP